MSRYTQHFSTRKTPQSQPIPGTTQVANSAGGYAFPVDDWVRLDRFLILGCEGGSYYASERALTVDNAQAVRRCLQTDGVRAVARIVEVSRQGRAPKNDPAIFALALAASLGDAATRALTLEALPEVCRTGTHLFQFAQAVQAQRGWGRGLRRAIGRWYTARPPRELAYQCIKYQSRQGWSHRDLLRLSHPKGDSLTQEVLHWAVQGWPEAGPEPHAEEALLPLWAFERAKRASSKEEVVRLVREYGLVRECVPTRWLTEPTVWEALLERMPLTALLRNLATLTRVGLLTPLSQAGRHVAAELTNRERLRQARVHPVAVLAALLTYSAGRGVRGQHTWSPVAKVADALDAAFYLSFANVEPTGKRWLLALDVSGSMGSGAVAGVPGLTPRVASAALALVTAAVEPQHSFVAFTSSGWHCQAAGRGQWAGMGYANGITPFSVLPQQRLDDVCRQTAALPMGGTDCALPMLYALEQRLAVDVFVVLTDSETWAGNVHPCQALTRYRQKMGQPAKLVVCGLVSNGFSIANPDDAGMLD
ncbi:MAG: TROVE domain-containing protein, partial [Planctomycetes bacterium]|nr:TROVE domain-containing protein [Planctomycetota bacterium]